MKVIFLDVDGVLNSERWWIKNNKRPHENGTEITRRYVRHLKWIVKLTGAVIVLSSSWRGSVKQRKDHPLHKILAEYGLEIYDYTISGRSSSSSARGYEIQAWLDDHRDVTNIVILDDDDDMIHLSKYLVKTRFNAYDGHESSRWWKEGLNLHKTIKAIAMLRKPYVNIYKTSVIISRQKF